MVAGVGFYSGASWLEQSFLLKMGCVLIVLSRFDSILCTVLPSRFSTNENCFECFCGDLSSVDFFEPNISCTVSSSPFRKLAITSVRFSSHVPIIELHLSYRKDTSSSLPCPISCAFLTCIHTGFIVKNDNQEPSARPFKFNLCDNRPGYSICRLQDTYTTLDMLISIFQLIRTIALILKLLFFPWCYLTFLPLLLLLISILPSDSNPPNTYIYLNIKISKYQNHISLQQLTCLQKKRNPT